MNNIGKVWKTLLCFESELKHVADLPASAQAWTSALLDNVCDGPGKSRSVIYMNRAWGSLQKLLHSEILGRN